MTINNEKALKIMGELEETAGSSDWGGNVVGLFSLLIQYVKPYEKVFIIF